MIVNKYFIVFVDKAVEIELPLYAKVLAFGEDGGFFDEPFHLTPRIVLWASSHEYQKAIKTITALVVETGHIMPQPKPGYDWKYVNTFKTNNDRVWHAFTEEKYDV